MKAFVLVFCCILNPAILAVAAPIPVRGLDCVSALSRDSLGVRDGLAVEHFTWLRILGREVIATQLDGQIQFHQITQDSGFAGAVSEYVLGSPHSNLLQPLIPEARPEWFPVTAQMGTVVVAKGDRTEILFARVLADNSLDLSVAATLEGGINFLDLDHTGQLILTVNAENTEVSLRSVHSPRVRIRTWNLGSTMSPHRQPGTYRIDARFAWDEDRMVAFVITSSDLSPLQIFRADRNLDVLEHIGTAQSSRPEVNLRHSLSRSSDGSEVYFTNHRILLGNSPGQMLQMVPFDATLHERITSFAPPAESDFATPEERAAHRSAVELNRKIAEDVSQSLARRQRQENSPVRRVLRNVLNFFASPSEPLENQVPNLQNWEERELNRVKLGDTAGVFSVSPDRSLAALRWVLTNSLTIVDLKTGKMLGAMSFSGKQFPSHIQYSEDGKTVYLGIPQTETDMPMGGRVDNGRIAAIRRWQIR